MPAGALVKHGDERRPPRDETHVDMDGKNADFVPAPWLMSSFPLPHAVDGAASPAPVASPGTPLGNPSDGTSEG